MGSSSKRQTTAAKRARELAVKERRDRKQEKRRAAAAARNAGTAEGTISAPAVDDDTSSDQAQIRSDTVEPAPAPVPLKP